MTRPMRLSFVTFPLLLASGFAIAAAACSSSDPPPGGPDASASCATTVQAMAGQPCLGADLRCAVDYPCGAFRQQAVCVCDEGTFACGDSQGALGPGEEPRCSDTTSPAATCPAAYAGTEGTACRSPWQYCTWVSPGCTAAPGPRLNGCLCRPNDRGSLSFVCEADPCDVDGGSFQAPAGDASDADADGG